MHFLITGSAGFIGFHIARRLLKEGHSVIGYDAMTEYYDKRLKQSRHAVLETFEGFTPVIARLEDMEALQAATDRASPDVIIHLAAQAGVRYSIDHPRSYVDANIVGTFNLLEMARRVRPRHTLLASTSSVYGANPHMPFSETDRADWPLSIYAATKKAMEDMAHTYAHLWDLPVTCFRFFTVYGPWGRPDMALFKFVAAILAGRPIELYGEGEMTRDFTYIDDLVEAVARLIDRPPVAGAPLVAPGVADTLSPVAPWRVVNIAGGSPVGLMEFVEAIADALKKPVTKVCLPMQPGDLRTTLADCHLLEALTGFRPETSIETGVKAFVDWYQQYSLSHAAIET